MADRRKPQPQPQPPLVDKRSYCWWCGLVYCAEYDKPTDWRWNTEAAGWECNFDRRDLKLSDVAKDGDIVFRYSTADNKLNPFTFVEGYGWDPGVADGPTLNVGEGFYYYNAGAAVEWKQSFTVGP